MRRYLLIAHSSPPPEDATVHCWADQSQGLHHCPGGYARNDSDRDRDGETMEDILGYQLSNVHLLQLGRCLNFALSLSFVSLSLRVNM